MLKSVEKWLFIVFLCALIFATFNRELSPAGYDIRLVPVALGAMAIVWSFIRCIGERRLPAVHLAGANVFLLWYLIFALVCNVAWRTSALPMVSDQFQVVFVANGLNLYFFAVIIFFREHLTWHATTWSIHLAGFFLFLSMFAVYRGFDLRNYFSEYAGGFSDGISSTPLGLVRYAGYAQDPNFASLFMVVWATVAIFDAWRARNIGYLLVVPLTGFGFVMSLSKSILVMLVLTVFLVAVNRFFIGAIAKELALLGLIGGTLLAAFEKIQLPTETLHTRVLLWRSPVQWFSQSPIIGNGLTAARSANIDQDWYVQIHSTVVQTFVELGIIGLFLYYLAVRRTLMSGSNAVVFITGAYLGTMLTYETMSHAFSVLILGIIPLAIKQAPKKKATSASIYVINGIAHGGAERVVQNMANNARDEEKVIIYLLAEKPSDAYALGPNVELRGIGKRGSKLLLPFYLWQLNRRLENDWARYRITLATAHLPFAQLVVRLSRFNADFIYVNHGMVHVSNTGLSGLMCKFLYNRRCNIAVSKQMLEEEVRQNFGIRSRHDDYIYNPIDMKAIAEHAGPEVGREKLVVSVGRYSPEKNLSVGIAAFDASGLAQEGYVYKLLGEGDLQEELQRDIDARGLTESVELVGFVDNPFAYMRKAAALLHPADYESFGMVIAEAHVCGCPVVAFDVPFASREVMPGRLREYLVEFNDVPALAAKLRDAVLGEYPSAETAQILDQLEPAAVMDKYYDTYAQWAGREVATR
ncbi:glycosyltransferase [Corynebacterium phoceense]|uniref:glycosyltransferase n=1 Tax=Corynebacterium phoceense TaxID=1686286 RepID=UPI00211BB9AF|nr:glycosyltransferase [Corynebacterium phoceense]MCQ9332369.1 glycosyltransferase [Corynebacterium phoceense]MCQ9349284.1 glycosyltransferase [Corynebacterium phoceense]